MTAEQYQAWRTQANAGEEIREWINGIQYIFTPLPDGWIAIFERDATEFAPLIQAANMAHARSYCVLREPLPVPVTIIE